MTRYESRSLPEFESFGPPVLADHREPPRSPPWPPAPPPGTGAAPGPASPGALDEHEFDVVAVLDDAGRFVFVSASAERLLGFDVSGAVGRDAFSLFDGSSHDHVRALFADLVARRRSSVSLGLRARRADGRPIDLDLVASNHLHDPIGGVVVNLREVTDRRAPERRRTGEATDRRALEERVREVTDRQATIIESLTDGVLIVDGTGAVARVNEAFEVMFEAPRVRLLGRRLGDLLAGARALGVELVGADGTPIDPLDHPVAASLAGGRRCVGVVVGVRRPDRPPMWVRANAQAVVDADGAVTGAVASFTDMTAARRAVTELHREERFLQVLLDTLEEGIMACDADGRITVFNPSARRLHGMPEAVDPIGEIPTGEGLRHPDGSPMAARENPLIRAMSERVRDVEVVLESATGERRKVSVNGQPLVDEEGWRLGAVVAMHDVTEQKRNEERLAELALHDPLTGLANRTLLAERLQQAIDRMAGRPPPRPGRPAGHRRVPARPRRVQGDQRPPGPRRR